MDAITVSETSGSAPPHSIVTPGAGFFCAVVPEEDHTVDGPDENAPHGIEKMAVKGLAPGQFCIEDEA